MDDKKSTNKPNNDKESSKRIIEVPAFPKEAVEIPSLIEKEDESIHYTGSTAASDTSFYFDQLKQQNNE